MHLETRIALKSLIEISKSQSKRHAIFPSMAYEYPDRTTRFTDARPVRFG
jgi:hypothetical protein